MSRKAQAPKREVLADPIYNSKQVTKLINQIMLDGKKGVAEHIVYSAFDIVAEKTGNDPSGGPVPDLLRLDVPDLRKA